MSNVEDFHNEAMNTGSNSRDLSFGSDFDPSRYSAAVEEFDLTDAQTHELLATLWSIMRRFVELGFQGDVSAMALSALAAIPDDDELG